MRDPAARTNWVAAVLPRCDRRACYRIDTVTLATRGVVFERGAIAPPYASRIVRRAFTAHAPTQLIVPNDPQPDLVPSSAGALYYVLGRGWFRWDFGHSRPQPTPYMGAKPPTLLRHERNRWVFLTESGCGQGIVVRGTGGNSAAVVAAGSIRARAGRRGRDEDCIQLTGLAWWRGRIFSAWAVEPKWAEQQHSDFGLVGLLLSSPRVR